MQASDKIKEVIKRFEGLRLKAYKDSKGIWTIGYGHTLNVKPGQVITKEEADELFERDLASFEKQLKPHLNDIKLSQNQYDAIVSLCYNIGVGAFVRSSIYKHLVRKEYNKAADAFLLYVYAGGQVLSGLQRRRRKERKIFLTGEYE